MITLRHEGRGGAVLVDGVAYAIDHVEGGCFSIAFRSGHPGDDAHRAALEAFAAAQDPPWSVDDRSRKPRQPRRPR